MYLQLKQLTKRFDSTTAVKDLSIDVDEGELVSILGPSGCGKTTTLKMVGGFISPSNGSVILEGTDITNNPPDQRPTSTVFQSYALFPHMNVIENVTYGLKFKDISREQALAKGEEMLEMIGLIHYRDKDISQLSGGEQQRVALARSLVMNPKVLLLDEPLSNLDAKLRVRMRKEIKELQSRLGITMLYVTHDQEEALSISDKIVVINQGKVMQIGTPEEIYHYPKNKFVAEFIGRTNIIENKNNEEFIIRPEYVKISENNTCYQGEIVQKQFVGMFITYFIDLGDTIIQSDVLSKEDKGWEIGEEIYISFPDDRKQII